jgi:hypothetical protein
MKEQKTSRPERVYNFDLQKYSIYGNQFFKNELKYAIQCHFYERHRDEIWISNSLLQNSDASPMLFDSEDEAESMALKEINENLSGLRIIGYQIIKINTLSFEAER